MRRTRACSGSTRTGAPTPRKCVDYLRVSLIFIILFVWVCGAARVWVYDVRPTDPHPPTHRPTTNPNHTFGPTHSMQPHTNNTPYYPNKNQGAARAAAGAVVHVHHRELRLRLLLQLDAGACMCTYTHMHTCVCVSRYKI